MNKMNKKILIDSFGDYGKRKGPHLGLFSEEDIRKILSVTTPTPLGIRDRAIMELLYSSGIRRGELAGLDCGDVDYCGSEIMVRMGKMDKERIVPVGDEALRALLCYLEVRDYFLRDQNEALFLSMRGRRIHGTTIGMRIVMWKKKAGVTTRGRAHAFRHSCASHLVKHGAPMRAVQRILGHENLSTTQLYTHIMKDDLKEAHKYAHPKAMEAE